MQQLINFIKSRFLKSANAETNNMPKNKLQEFFLKSLFGLRTFYVF